MVDKIFKDYDELIEIMRERGIVLDTPNDKDYARRLLEREGYYNLINGYSKLFLVSNNTNQYVSGTTLYEIHALYQFDRSLRNIFFRYILNIETHVKNLIAHTFSQKYGHSNYLLYNNFNTSGKNAQANITALIAEIQRQISSRTSDPSIAHYLREYGYIPLWVLNNILTLGTISKFYSLMKVEERQSVSRVFKIMDNELENELLYLSSIRNFCAHGNRLYCYRTKKPLLDTPLHKALAIPQNDTGEYIQGKRDLFAALIALKRLLSNNDYNRLCKEISCSLTTLEKKLNLLSCKDILNIMGFPENWINLKSIIK